MNQDYPGLRDVINVPWQIGDTPGEVKLIIPFLNPLMVGKFVYHCHIVGHEDAGMMQNIEVFRPRSTRGRTWDRVRELASDQLPELWRQSRGPGQCRRARWPGPTTRPPSAAALARGRAAAQIATR